MKNSVVLACGVAACALGCGVPAWAQETEARGDEEAGESEAILVTASRESTVRIENYTGSVSILSADQLEQRQVRDIAEALRDVPGVAVSGVAGQTQVRLRGSEANHVLVLVDGIEVSDPFAGEFDLGTLQAEPGARVEVLRGPQSALYGPDAIGGVIAYQSASGRDLEGFSARLEGGTQGTVNGAAHYGAVGNGWDAALSAVVVSTDGQPNARGGSRDIGRDSYTVSGKGSVELAPGLSVRAVGRYILTEGRFNNSDNDSASPTFGFIVDSPGSRFENEAVYALVGARYEALDGAWTHDLSAQVANIARDTFGAAGRTNGSEGDRLKASYVTAFGFDTGEVSHSLTFAADWERERFRNTDPSGFAFTGRRQIENTGLVGEYRLDARRFDVSAALRHDINDRFADETTYRIGAGVDLTDTTRLRAAAASGIKNPGFFELFGFVDGRFIGNEDLRPERSEGWEVGIDQRLFADRVTISATYFDSELEGEIFTTFPPPTFVATPGNRDTVSTQQGVEVALAATLSRSFTLNAAYSHIDSEEDGTTEVRRPEDIASAALTWSAPGDAASATLVVRHNGATEDLAFTDPSFVPVRVVLDDYTLVNLNARVKLAEGIELFGRVDNLLDERYEQVFSFVSPGRSVVIGIEGRF
ncbi:MAG: TonB-dependent receptor [Alphaproteobacteria bacterium]|nr:TonB-dependent receptor [Alphaproteobacteria bacterium]